VIGGEESEIKQSLKDDNLESKVGTPPRKTQRSPTSPPKRSPNSKTPLKTSPYSFTCSPPRKSPNSNSSSPPKSSPNSKSSSPPRRVAEKVIMIGKRKVVVRKKMIAKAVVKPEIDAIDLAVRIEEKESDPTFQRVESLDLAMASEMSCGGCRMKNGKSEDTGEGLKHAYAYYSVSNVTLLLLIEVPSVG
jgi:hypothetical protein